ncbi:MAG: TolB family protein [Cyclobacteriaceae bacterium]
MKTTLFFYLISFAIVGWSQPATEVWLFDISSKGTLSNPINISNNPGYDNQPSFTRGGNKLLYTSTQNNQTDIVSYNIKTTQREWLTSTPGGEYSPTQIPSSDTFSTILLEENGRQLLWKYSLNGGNGEILIPFIKIGYHTWLSDEELYAFVLGPHSTLQHINITTQRAEIIQENIGRSLATYNSSIVYIDQSVDKSAITILNPVENEKRKLLNVLEGSEDFAISSDGFIYMGQGDLLFRTSLAEGSDWMQIADLTKFGRSGISRLAIAPDNLKIAIVLTE